jgi:hypothetical protein
MGAIYQGLVEGKILPFSSGQLTTKAPGPKPGAFVINNGFWPYSSKSNTM